MGNHGAAGARLRAGGTSQHAREPAILHARSPRALTLRDWPVSWRLIAVIVLALVMGLVFGGLRVAAAADSAAEFGRVAQLADLGQQVTGLVQALQDERDQTTGIIPASSPQAADEALQHWYQATDASAGQVQVLAAGIGGSFPANIQSRVATVLSVIHHLGALRTAAQASQSALAVIADYSAPIGDMIALNDQIAEGTADSGLASSVQALNLLSLAKDEATQQRAILFNAFSQQLFADDELPALTTAVSEQATNLSKFDTTVSSSEQNAFRNTVAGPRVNQAELIEEYVISVGSLDTGALHISPGAAPRQWYSAMSDTVDKMQAFELGVAKSIVSRSQSLQQGARQSALYNAILTVVVLLLVLIATLVVARSLVRPLRRLREGALDIATVQLPERVRQLGEAQDPTTSLEVAPIDVLSADEIGQVARAFDQVHAEAVRLAGNEAMLRNSFNAMFVNLSRRSQSLIERLARMIDSLEQNEADPNRLSNLFSMDHLVTRMRRNSENLLLLAGHESARKWSEPVPLADVARAAVSEIEQYSRVTLKVQPGVAVSGQAVSDFVHLLAEVIENATIYSAADTPVHVSAQEVSTGGVLIEVSDSGVGIPEARMAEMNWRLDNPPVMDVSVSRHMGLFAVARLAERHGVRVRMRAGSPRGLTALVWLPDSVIERGARSSLWLGSRHGRQTPAAARQTSGSHSTGTDGRSANGRFDTVVPPQVPPQASVPTAPEAPAPAAPQPPAPTVPQVPVPTAPQAPAQTATYAAAQAPAQTAAYAAAGSHVTAPAGPATSDWFRSRRSGASDTNGNGGGSSAPSPQVESGRHFGTDGWAEGKHAAQIIADPVRGEHTAAGLPMRVPRANLLPGSARGSHWEGSGGAGRPVDSHDAGTSAAARPQRSPDAARSRLSGFQRGTRRAKGEETPRAGEGADR